MKKLNLSFEKKIKIGFVLVVTLAEIILMFFCKEISAYGLIVMFLLYIPDAIISFIRKDEDKWIDLSFVCIYLILFVINAVLLRV